VERHAADIDLTFAWFAEHAPHLAMQVLRSSQQALARVSTGDIAWW
jgi:hypothetical protein